MGAIQQRSPTAMKHAHEPSRGGVAFVIPDWMEGRVCNSKNKSLVQ